MDRDQLVIATALALFAAFLLGWLAGGLLSRLSGGSRAHLDEIDQMARQLIQAEIARDHARTQLEEREAILGQALTDADADRETLRETLDAARLEIHELRAYIDKHLAGG